MPVMRVAGQIASCELIHELQITLNPDVKFIFGTFVH